MLPEPPATKGRNPLPKTDETGALYGAVIPERKRCGKPACHCASGQPADLHGPYYYRYWRERGGRLRKSYVRLADLDRVRTACVTAAKERADRVVTRRESREVARLIDDYLHSIESLIEGARRTAAAVTA